MSTLVETPTAAGSQVASSRHSLGSNATFGTPGAVQEVEDRGKALARPSVSWNDASMTSSNGQSAGSVSASRTGGGVVPEVNLNGTALPTPAASGSRTAQRPQKSSTAAVAEAETSAWGANFWVTLIDPQVRVRSCLLVASVASYVSMALVHRVISDMKLIDTRTVLCVPGDGPGELGSPSRKLCVSEAA